MRSAVDVRCRIRGFGGPEYPGGGHGFPQTHSGIFNADLLGFIEEDAAQGRPFILATPVSA
jgi:non-heme chloroperoxidase